MPSKREDRKAKRAEKVTDAPNYFVSDYYKFESPTMTPEQAETAKAKAKKDRMVQGGEFEAYCKWAAKTFPSMAQDERITPEYVDAMNFLSWKITPGELNAGSRAAYVFGGVAGALIALYGLITVTLEGDPLYLGMYALFGLFTFIAAPQLVKSYPLSAAQDQKSKILIEIPKIIGYMNMSMKLSPNLERAAEFASEHGEGKLATALGELLWGTRTGIYGSLEEGLDELAYTWGKYSIEFKQALMTVRSSVLEPDDARRHALLDSALSEALKAVGNKMSDQAVALKGPSMNMFYLGVLLPLVLIIVIPIGSVFSDNSIMSNPFVLTLVYNVVIPVGVFVYAGIIIAARPPIYSPPEIPDSHPELPPKGMFRVGGMRLSIMVGTVAMVVAGLAGTWLLHAELDPSPDRIVQQEFDIATFAAGLSHVERGLGCTEDVILERCRQG